MLIRKKEQLNMVVLVLPEDDKNIEKIKGLQDFLRAFLFYRQYNKLISVRYEFAIYSIGRLSN